MKMFQSFCLVLMMFVGFEMMYYPESHVSFMILFVISGGAFVACGEASEDK